MNYVAVGVGPLSLDENYVTKEVPADDPSSNLYSMAERICVNTGVEYVQRMVEREKKNRLYRPYLIIRLGFIRGMTYKRIVTVIGTHFPKVN